jgi:putative ABC transport system permease protein
VSFMSLRIAIRALMRNWLRSTLTMLGVIIGVAAVIAMVAIGQGATKSVQKSIASMGQNLLMVIPGSSSSGAVHFGSGTVQTLAPQDAAAIGRDCPSAESVSITVRARGVQCVNENQNWSPREVQGTDPAFLDVRDWPMAEGECFNEQDVRTAAAVCILGSTVAEKLFGDQSPVGKRIRIKNLPFRIAGVLEKKGGNAMGQDQDDTVLMPWTTVKKKLQGSAFNNIDQLLVQAKTSEGITALEEEIKTALRVTHKLQKNGRGQYDDDFTVRNMTEMMNAMASTTQTMTMLLMAVAAISLLVGGIGIMNIMLVSVTERTREIGLRMAIGARGIDILAQFLVEATMLSGLGGVAGIALGSGGAFLAAWLMRWPATISPVAVVLAVVFSAGVGMFFGFYPAWRASKLDPIEALRYE